MNIRDAHRKTFVGLFTGQEYHLKKIRITEFLQYIGNMPAENSNTLQEQLKFIGEKTREIGNDKMGAEELTRFYLEHGVVSPKIFFGAYSDCPEDQMHYDDMGDDASMLVGAIAEYSFDFSGFKKKMELLLQQQQPGTPGHDSETIRAVTDGSPTDGNGA